MQLLSLSALRTPLQHDLERPLTEPWTVSNVHRRWTLGQTDADVCALIVHWAKASLPELLPLQMDAAATSADEVSALSWARHLRVAERAYLDLWSTLITLWCQDQTALPQPRLSELQGVHSDITKLMLRLKQAASSDDPAPPEDG